MHRFSIWAPKAKAMFVEVAGVRHPMERGDRGWWSADVEEVEHGSDYSFRLDDYDQAYPDPRSACQPYGVHSASRVVDHSRFAWTDDGWSAVPLSQAVVYELHVGTFTPELTFASAATN